MKRVFSVVFTIALIGSMVFVGEAVGSSPSFASNNQVGYLKRKTRKVVYRTKSGSKYAARKTVKGTRWTARKTTRGTKKVYVKTKTAVQ